MEVIQKLVRSRSLYAALFFSSAKRFFLSIMTKNKKRETSSEKE
jgi:hypothetical protein